MTEQDLTALATRVAHGGTHQVFYASEEIALAQGYLTVTVDLGYQDAQIGALKQLLSEARAERDALIDDREDMMMALADLRNEREALKAQLEQLTKTEPVCICWNADLLPCPVHHTSRFSHDG